MVFKKCDHLSWTLKYIALVCSVGNLNKSLKTWYMKLYYLENFFE